MTGFKILTNKIKTVGKKLKKREIEIIIPKAHL